MTEQRCCPKGIILIDENKPVQKTETAFSVFLERHRCDSCNFRCGMRRYFLLKLFEQSDVFVPTVFVLAVFLIARFTTGYLYGVLGSLVSVVDGELCIYLSLFCL